MSKTRPKGTGFYFECYNAKGKVVCYGYVANTTEAKISQRLKSMLRKKRDHVVGAAWKGHPKAVGYAEPDIFVKTLTGPKKKGK